MANVRLQALQITAELAVSGVLHRWPGEDSTSIILVAEALVEDEDIDVSEAAILLKAQLQRPLRIRRSQKWWHPYVE